MEYHPIEDVDVAEPVFAQFCDMLTPSTSSLMGQFVPVKASFSDYKLDSIYTGKHCALQYLGLVYALLNVLLAPGVAANSKAPAAPASGK